jgi:hypothetical protein
VVSALPFGGFCRQGAVMSHPPNSLDVKNVAIRGGNTAREKSDRTNYFY